MRNLIIIIILIPFLGGCSYKDVTITGKVYIDDPPYNEYNNETQPLPGVKVQSGNLQTETVDDGSFSITGKIVGNEAEIKLFFSKEGYISRTVKVVIQPAGEEGGIEIFSPELDLNQIVMKSNN